MKILQIIQRPQLRGAEIFACQLSEELIRSGHQADMLYLFPQKNALKYFKLNFDCLEAVPANRFWDIKAYKRLSKIIRAGRYDVVQANAGDTLKYAAMSKLIFGWKAKLIYRNANKMGDFIKNQLHKKLNQFFLAQADYYISVSENCRLDLIELYPEAMQKSATGTIGTYHFDQINPFETKSDQGPVWINVGSFVAEKNHAFLINLFYNFYKNTGTGEFWLVGDGKLRKQLEKQVSKLGLNERVIFWGFRRDAVSLLKAADIMVMPSTIEGLPGVILESLSVGVPVVAAKVGGIPEVISSEETGFCIEGYDSEDYLREIYLVLSDKRLYEKIAENGKKLIHEKFLMPKIAIHFADIYKHVLGNC